MQLNLLKSKIHRAEITDSSLNYEGSLALMPNSWPPSDSGSTNGY